MTGYGIFHGMLVSWLGQSFNLVTSGLRLKYYLFRSLQFGYPDALAERLLSFSH